VSPTLPASLGVAAIADNGTLNLGAGNGLVTTVTTPISGSGNVTGEGPGTVTLDGNDTYSGLTTVSGGTLKMGSANAIPSGEAVHVNGTLDLAGQNLSVSSLTGGSAGIITDGDGSTSTLTDTTSTIED
jgi:fibronectin-binding autotransporter adhesin